eukprot:scaffold1389_cov251-Ochromonas_danica.AAC.38
MILSCAIVRAVEAFEGTCLESSVMLFFRSHMIGKFLLHGAYYVFKSQDVAGLLKFSDSTSFQPAPGDFQPQNILITGGAGFIASHVVLLLAKKYPNIKIVNFDRLDCEYPSDYI